MRSGKYPITTYNIDGDKDNSMVWTYKNIGVPYNFLSAAHESFPAVTYYCAAAQL